MKITLRGFGGMAPKLHPLALNERMAQSAVNLNPYSGDLRPWRENKSVWATTKTGPILSLHKFGERIEDEIRYWFHSASDVDYVRGPVPGDVQEKTYYTGEGAPKKTDNALALTGGGTNYPINSYLLGVPQPDNSPMLAVTGDVEDEEVSVTVSYVYTFVTGWGEEGPPCLPSDTITVRQGESAVLSNMSTTPTGNYDVTHKRIYRATTGTSGTSYYLLVAEVTSGTTSYTDDDPLTGGTDALVTADWFEPPEDLHSLIALPVGSLAGLSKLDVWVSEPYVPYAWPAKYKKTLPHPPVGLGTFGGTIVVATAGPPYASAISHPAYMNFQKVELNEGCVSKRGIVSMPYGVVYPAAEGLALVAPGASRIITEPLMSRKEWANYNPSSISAWAYGNLYVGFYVNGSTKRGFVFDLTNEMAQWTELDFHATAGYYDKLRDALFLVIGDTVHRFDGHPSSYRTCAWRSKMFRADRQVSYDWIQVIADGYPVTITLYRDGVQVYSRAVASSAPIKLPSITHGFDWEVAVSSQYGVHAVTVAEALEELNG